MTGPLARVAAWLVEPAAAAAPRAGDDVSRAKAGAPRFDDARVDRGRASTAAGAGSARARRRPVPSPLDIALLAPAADASALGAALALKATGGVAALGVWTGDGRPRPAAQIAPRTPGARRVATSLQACGLQATAAGRLVSVALPASEADSAAAARRLLAVDVPVVLAVGGPRAGAWDELLREFALVLVHAPERALEELTIARLAEQEIAAEPFGATPGPLARSFARAGLALPGGVAIPEAGR